MLDPFAGSGTTLMAAEATGRTAALVELDPAYSDVIVQRWQEGTGGTAVREDGTGFDALAGERERNTSKRTEAGEQAEADQREGVVA